MLKANQFATCHCEISWLFSLALTCQSLLIFESCIIIKKSALPTFNDVISSCGSYSVIGNFPGFSHCFTNQSQPILKPLGDNTKYPLQAFNDVISDAHSGL